MKEYRLPDEYLEALWVLLERRGTIGGILESGALAGYFGDQYRADVTDGLVRDGRIVRIDEASRDGLAFTPAGQRKARQLIRAHRLAERLLHDVLGIEDYEVGACEFEHIFDTNLIDSICTLLGHPKRNPVGLPIPEGNCCRSRSEFLPPPTIPVVGMRTGDAGRIASVNADDDTRLHMLENLQLRPGSLLRVHQTSPTIVLECEGSTVAVDESIAAHIRVWPLQPEEAEHVAEDEPGYASLPGEGSSSGTRETRHPDRQIGRWGRRRKQGRR